MIAARWGLMLAVISSPAIAQQAPLTTVPSVDLGRYMGQWYEIARNQNRWEDHCVSDVVVTYVMKPDGSMSFGNVCTKKDGTSSSSHASAKVVDRQTNAKLKVTFLWPLAADYWIIALDKDYRWAVVGQPDRDYIWVIAREASLPQTTLDAIRTKVDASGYKSSALIYTRQTAAHVAAR